MFRIVLFLATNMAIIVLLGMVMSLLGVDSRTTSGLLVMAAIFGMGGSFISLAMSKWIAKKIYRRSSNRRPKKFAEHGQR